MKNKNNTPRAADCPPIVERYFFLLTHMTKKGHTHRKQNESLRTCFFLSFGLQMRSNENEKHGNEEKRQAKSQLGHRSKIDDRQVESGNRAHKVI